IVLCSPQAASSRWVNEEIRYFKSIGRDDRMLAVILRGEPNASDDPTIAVNECFPPALRYKLNPDGSLSNERTEPIAGDLRPQGDGQHAVVLKAVAGIIGTGYNSLAKREAKRRRIRHAIAAVAGIVLLAGGIYSWDYLRTK